MKETGKLHGWMHMTCLLICQGLQYTLTVKCRVKITWKVVVGAVTMWSIFATSVAHSATYYVSPGGDDRGHGTKKAPWKTLIHAVNQLAPGDTLNVLPGRYAGFYMRRRNSGKPGARVRIIAREGAIIDRMLDKAKDGINVEYASYIDIEGFTVTSAERAGIRAVECRDVHIRRNTVHDNGRWGVFTGFCDELLIEDNVIWGSKREHGIYVSNSAKRAVIRGNRIFGNAVCGIHTNGDASMGRDGMTSEALIENNIIYNNGRKGGAGINNDGIRKSIIRNNLIYNNYANGITLYRIDGKHSSTGNKVINNTIVMPRGEKSSRWCIRIFDGSSRNIFKNNICINGHHYRGAIDISRDSLPGFVSDHNILDGRFTITDGNSVIGIDKWRKLSGQDRHSIVATYDDLPGLFADPANGDYRLAPGAVAVDRADPTFAPAVDIAGRDRNGGAPDLGALELCDSCPPVLARSPAPRDEHAGSGDTDPGDRDAPAPDQTGPRTGTKTGAAGDRDAPASDKPGSARQTPESTSKSGSGCCTARSRGNTLPGTLLLGLVALVSLRRRGT